MASRKFRVRLLLFMAGGISVIGATAAWLTRRQRSIPITAQIDAPTQTVELSTAAPMQRPRPADTPPNVKPMLWAAALVVVVLLILIALLLPPEVRGGLIRALLVGAIVGGLLGKGLQLPKITRFAYAPQVLTGVALGFSLFAVLQFRALDQPTALLVGVFAFGAAVPILGTALRLSMWQQSFPSAAAASNIEVGSVRRGALIGAGVLALLLIVFNVGIVMPISQHLQIVMFVALLCLLAFAFAGTKTSAVSPANLGKLLRIHWLLIGILVLAFGLRVWQLHSTVRTPVDELAFMTAVNTFATRSDIPLIAPMGGVFPFSKVFSYLQSQLVFATDRSWSGFRLIGAITGTLNVLALWGLARTLFDRQVALLAAVLFAALPPALHFGRLGLNNIADPLFGTLTLWFLARGLIHGNRRDAVLGGIMLCLTQYFHESGRLLFPPLVIAWLLAAVYLWRAQAHWRNLRAALLAAVIGALPFYVAYFAMGYSLTSRVGAWGFNGEYLQQLLTMPSVFVEHLVEKTIPAFTFYVGHPDSSIYFGGYEPLLLVYVAPFFLLGICAALWHWQKPAMLLLLLWVVATSAGNGLLVGAATSIRFLPVFPALALLVAIGLHTTSHLLLPARQGLRRAALISLTALLVIGQTVYYFRDHLPILDLQSRFARTLNGALDGIDAMERAAALRPGTHIYILGDPPFNSGIAAEVLYYFTGEKGGMLVFERDVAAEPLDNTFFRLLTSTVDNAFFVEPDDWATIERLRAEFPTLEGPVGSPFDMPSGVAYVLYLAQRGE